MKTIYVDVHRFTFGNVENIAIFIKKYNMHVGNLAASWFKRAKKALWLGDYEQLPLRRARNMRGPDSTSARNLMKLSLLAELSKVDSVKAFGQLSSSFIIKAI